MFCKSVAILLTIASCQQNQPQPLNPSPTPKPIAVLRPETPSPAPKLTGWPAIQEQRWAEAKIKKEKVHFAQAIATKIENNQARYLRVSVVTNVPWQAIASLHSLEGDLSFSTHLHNGDPLYAQTKHVPHGRPPNGKPPFLWEDSAIDAIRFDKLDLKDWRTVGSTLNDMEGFNGFGYQKRGVVSPYMHSYDQLYVRGKFTSDGKYDPEAVSQQCGVVPILKSLNYNAR
jgi:lysozyme family protein